MWEGFQLLRICIACCCYTDLSASRQKWVLVSVHIFACLASYYLYWTSSQLHFPLPPFLWGRLPIRLGCWVLLRIESQFPVQQCCGHSANTLTSTSFLILLWTTSTCCYTGRNTMPVTAAAAQVLPQEMHRCCCDCMELEGWRHYNGNSRQHCDSCTGLYHMKSKPSQPGPQIPKAPRDQARTLPA